MEWRLQPYGRSQVVLIPLLYAPSAMGWGGLLGLVCLQGIASGAAPRHSATATAPSTTAAAADDRHTHHTTGTPACLLGAAPPLGPRAGDILAPFGHRGGGLACGAAA